MKKFLLILFAVFVCSDVFAGTGLDSDTTCFARDGGYHDEFWYCGGDGGGCNREHDWSSDKRHFYYHGQCFTWPEDRKTYCCCGGTFTEKGHFIEGVQGGASNGLEKSEVKTIGISNGTCKYTQYTNVCDGSARLVESGTNKEISDPSQCTHADTCSSNMLSRNGECVAPCAGGSAFETVASNKCVSCPTTTYSGIKNDVCVSCNEATEFFDAYQSKCISNANFDKYTKMAMNKCFMCNGSDLFKACVYRITKGINLSGYDDTKIINGCYLKDLTL